ncbi:MAG TPA: nucleoid-associated protein [Anaerolineaceae bacterium]|nr:nucleoid-associated protein [Anaerolineaceae bacterium]
MTDDSQIDLLRCAYHFVDRHSAELRCSPAELDLSAANPAICQFFAEMTTDFWNAEDSGITVSGVFAGADSPSGPSPARPLIAAILADPATFFDQSVALATRLYDCSPTNSSPGILVVLLCRHLQSGLSFLALYKLRYRDETIVRLLDGGQVPRLEVEQIRNILLKELQKGALIPHPGRQRFDLKVTDRQGDEPAAYFKEKFLGCQTKKSDEHQVRRLLPELAQYAHQAGLSLSPLRLAEVIAGLRGAEASITTEMLADMVERHELYGHGFSRADFLAYLQHSDHLAGLDIPPTTFQRAGNAGRKVIFEFTHGTLENVVLSAPPEALAEILSIDGDTVTFTIRTTSAGYQARYE